MNYRESRELEVRIAKELMGWKDVRLEKKQWLPIRNEDESEEWMGNEPGRIRTVVPYYSREHLRAIRVLDRLEELGYSWGIFGTNKYSSALSGIAVGLQKSIFPPDFQAPRRDNNDISEYWGLAPNIPEAICEAVRILLDAHAIETIKVKPKKVSSAS